jgi:hypothetical protein
MGQRGVQPRRPRQRIPRPENGRVAKPDATTVSASRMASLQRRDLRDLPAVLLSDPTVPAVVAATASLIAGEPRRALALLDTVGADARSAPDWAAIHNLATILDVNWWPGDIGAGQDGDPPEVEQLTVHLTGNDRTDLVLAVVSQVQPQMLSIRTITRASVRVQASSGAEAARYLSQNTRSILSAAAQVDVSVASSLAVELADLYRLGGLGAEAGQYLAWAKQAYESMDDPAGRARCLVVEADWLVTPATFVETLGFDLEDLDYVRPVPKPQIIKDARNRYGEAATLFRSGGAVRGEAATLLRKGFLDVLAGRPERADRSLRAAARLCREAGDGAAALLTEVHATLAAVAAGQLSAARDRHRTVGTHRRQCKLRAGAHAARSRGRSRLAHLRRC